MLLCMEVTINKYFFELARRHGGIPANAVVPCQNKIILKNKRLRYDGSRPGVQSASLYDNFRKRRNYVIMTS